MTVISLKDVHKKYPLGKTEVHAVKGVSFDIESGDFISIAGPSGSGKSTILNMIGCIDTASEGIVTINNINTSDLNDKEITNLRHDVLGFIFQNFNLIDNNTIAYNYLRSLYLVDIEKDSITLFKKFKFLVKDISYNKKKTKVALALNKSNSFKELMDSYNYLAILDIEKDTVFNTDIAIQKIFNWSLDGRALLVKDSFDLCVVEFPSLKKRKFLIDGMFSDAFFIDNRTLVVQENQVDLSEEYSQLVLYDLIDNEIKDTLYSNGTYISNISVIY